MEPDSGKCRNFCCQGRGSNNQGWHQRRPYGVNNNGGRDKNPSFQSRPGPRNFGNQNISLNNDPSTFVNPAGVSELSQINALCKELEKIG